MVTKQWKVRPQIDPAKKKITLGSGDPDGDGVWIGGLAEVTSGKQPQVWMTTDKEQVIAIVGKRGSGKSFTLGVIAEALSASTDGKLGRQENPRAVLLFDPLDIYWTTRYPVSPLENAEAQRHYQLAKSAGLEGATFEVEAWIPGEANAKATDPEWFQSLRLPVSALGLEEWELLLDVNIMTQPMGQALADALDLVRNSGYRLGGEDVAPRTEFDLRHLSDAVRSDDLSGIYHQETTRALRQRLSSMARTGLFSTHGTTIEQLLSPGRVTIVMLGRLPDGYRTAIVAVLTRMLIGTRSETAFAEKRLVLDPELTDVAKAKLEATVAGGVAKTVVVLDEAQSFLAPGAKTAARDLFVRLVKEGRNMGLSAILATQQPSALDQKILSQVETFIAHQLVTEPDIRAVRDNLKSSVPDSIQFGSNALGMTDLLRQLPSGFCLISAADMNTTIRRAFVAAIRPRATVHGGIEL